MATRPKDPRSTGRKRGRAVLQKSKRRYECECVDEDHDWHEGKCAWKPDKQSRSQTLDVDHLNKNVLDNDPINLRWKCRRCHKASDAKTAKGVMPDTEEDKLYGGLLEGY